MKPVKLILGLLCLIGGLASTGAAQEDKLYTQVKQLMDSTRLVEGHIFAPKKYGRTLREFDKATQAIERGKKARTIEEHLTTTAEYADLTISAAATGKLTLEEYLEPREKAKKAKAPALVSTLYEKAEMQFLKATEKVESGDVKGGLKEATKSIPLFEVAEMEAIRADIMGRADALIQKAVEGEAQKHAPSTLDKARTARTKCDGILTKDRYNRDESLATIGLAEYEARHALEIATSVRSLKRNDQAWEKLIQSYEIEMNRVAKTIGAEFLPFDRGATAAADSLIYYIRHLQSNAKSTGELNDELAAKLLVTIQKLDPEYYETDLIMLAERLDLRIKDVQTEQQSLADQITEKDYMLAQLQADHQEVAAELETRTEKEEKFKKAKMVLNPSEGEVLFNSSNDIVLRLYGLSFDVNKSDIKDEHIPLLEKVRSVIEMFDGSKIVVEGHTDASGESSANVTLSEKRAYAVMQYLRQSLLISADRITSIGYGDEKPVASNQTTDGRAKNRRIDIIIMH
jgi:outer membrane protein OmpA-like peptidoglycan-associated protein